MEWVELSQLSFYALECGLNQEDTWLYRIQIPNSMKLFPTTLFLMIVSLVDAQRILEPVSVYINQNGLPVIETYHPDKVVLFSEEDEIISSINGYEIDNPCIYTHQWYRITPDTPAIFSESVEYDTSLKEFSILQSARQIYFTSLYPEIDNYQPFVYWPYFTVDDSAGSSDTTITYDLYPYSLWDGYYQAPPRHEFLDVTYRLPNQIDRIKHGGISLDPDSNEVKMPFTTWFCDNNMDHLAHIEIISHYDSTQYGHEELPTQYYKKNAYMQYDKKDKLERILVHKGDILSSPQYAMTLTEDSLRKAASSTNDYFRSETIRHLTDSNYSVSGYLHYIYTGDYLKEVIAFSANYSGVQMCTFEYDNQNRLIKVVHSTDQEISSVFELSYSKNQKRVKATRQILPIHGEYPASVYFQDVHQSYQYDSKKRVKSVFMTSKSDELGQWQEYYYGDD